MKIKNRKIAILTIISSLAICISAQDAEGNDFGSGGNLSDETIETFKKVTEDGPVAFVNGLVEETKKVLGGSEEDRTEATTQIEVVEFEGGKLVSEEVVSPTIPASEQAPATENQQSRNNVFERMSEEIKKSEMPDDVKLTLAKNKEPQNSSDNSRTVPALEQPVAPNVNPAVEPQQNTVKQEDAPEIVSNEQKQVDTSKTPAKNPDLEQSMKNSDQSNSNTTQNPQQNEEIAPQGNDSVDLTKEGDGSQQNSNEQNNEAAPLKPEPAWAQNIKEVVVEASADGVVAYAIYNGINAVERFGKLIVAVADDEAVEADAQDGALFTKSETAKILISCASAGALRALLGESALAASIKQDGRVTVVVLATLVGNQLIVHGIPRVVASAAANYPKTTIATGLSVAALAYCCKDAVAGWVEKQTAKEAVGNNAVLIGACSIAAVSVGVTLATWAYNTYGPQKQK